MIPADDEFPRLLDRVDDLVQHEIARLMARRDAMLRDCLSRWVSELDPLFVIVRLDTDRGYGEVFYGLAYAGDPEARIVVTPRDELGFERPILFPSRPPWHALISDTP